MRLRTTLSIGRRTSPNFRAPSTPNRQPQNLARHALCSNSVLLHVSTDYVFTDSLIHAARRNRSPRRQVYARASWPARSLCRPSVRRVCRPHLRPLWSCPIGRQGKLCADDASAVLAAEGRPSSRWSTISAAASYAADVAVAIWRLLESRRFGRYHATDARETNSARVCLRNLSGGRTRRARGRDSLARLSPKGQAPRKRVDCSKLAATIGSALPTWQNTLARYVPQIVGDYCFPPRCRTGSRRFPKQ